MIAIAAAAFGTRTPRATCAATARSMTPVGWSPPSTALPAGDAVSDSARAGAPLELVADVALPGAAKRFDYQSYDSTTGRLYISHMYGNRLDVFDTRTQRLVASNTGFPGATGVWAVPELHHVYVSVTGRHEVAVVDDRTLEVVARVSGADFPDGIAYAPGERQVFVSDERGGVDLVIDGVTSAKVGAIALGGEAGNTHYDAVSHCMLVAVQTRNDLAAIDPVTRRIVARYPMPCEHPHGFLIDEPKRLLFMSCEGDSKLLVVNLRTMRTTDTYRVAEGPDVLALDPGLHLLYVACESGAVDVFEERQGGLILLGAYRASHAHTVAVDPGTHHVYLPLQDVNGAPVLRILMPSSPIEQRATEHASRSGAALRRSRD
jgi:DNA-binding beta-propeller fold protein YncE